jgi:ATP/ADP translocase
MKEKSFVFFAMLSAFLICGEYAVTRPTSNALFLTAFSAKAYPWVWLATIPLNLLVVFFYNRYLPKFGPLKIITWVSCLIILINALTAKIGHLFPGVIFFQYAWKDIYILLMLKQLWSMIHSTVNPANSKYFYGIIYGTGTIGAILGSLIPTFLAPVFGTEGILFFTLPGYLVLLFSYQMAYRRSSVNSVTFEKDLTPTPTLSEAFSLIKRTPILIAVLLLVIFMQMSVGIMEYQFNAKLELNILDKDLRTAYYGKIVAIINMISLGLQFLGGFLMVQALGLKRSHFLIPIFLCASALIALSFPTFAVVSCSYIFLKAIDFSLFGVIREMLYVPLALDAKFRAKAIIDVFAYRTSKGLVSLGLLVLQVLAGSAIFEIAGILSITVFAAWLMTVIVFFRKEELMQRP